MLRAVGVGVATADLQGATMLPRRIAWALSPPFVEPSPHLVDPWSRLRAGLLRSLVVRVLSRRLRPSREHCRGAQLDRLRHECRGRCEVRRPVRRASVSLHLGTDDRSAEPDGQPARNPRANGLADRPQGQQSVPDDDLRRPFVTPGFVDRAAAVNAMGPRHAMGPRRQLARLETPPVGPQPAADADATLRLRFNHVHAEAAGDPAPLGIHQQAVTIAKPPAGRSFRGPQHDGIW